MEISNVIPLILSAIVLLGLFEATSHSTYDGYIKDEGIREAKELLESQYLILNPFNENIISYVGVDKPSVTYIAKVVFLTPLCRWYLNGYGMIPRWTKLSKEIDRKHQELLNQQQS